MYIMALSTSSADWTIGIRAEESLKGVDGLSRTTPGIDARDLFLRLPGLKKLAVEPATVPENDTMSVSPTRQAMSEDTEGATLENSTLDSVPSNNPVEAGEVTSNPRPNDGQETITVTEPPLPVLEQLFILLEFIEDHYKDTVDELARLKADGYTTFKLLWTLCAPGSTVETKDQVSELPIGVSVTSWGYGNE